MSTKCSSGAGPYPLCPFGTSPLDKGSRPRRRFAQSLVAPGEAQRSGFAGKRRSKGTNAVFAARRKRSGVDFATTSRRGQSHSPPVGGEILPVKRTTQRPDEGIGPYKNHSIIAPSSAPFGGTFPPRGRLLGEPPPSASGGKKEQVPTPLKLSIVNSKERKMVTPWQR